MKKFWIVLTMVMCSGPGFAQSSYDSVRQVVNRMFAAMKNADTTALRSCFSANMVLQTVDKNKEGRTIVLTEPAEAFTASIKQLSPGDADEQIVFEMVKVDGPLAMAWTPYKFFYKGKFWHCGVNSFQLVRFDGVWKIQYIIDTRRRDACE